MAKLQSIERRIANVERFEVIVRHADGRDMRSDREGLPMYDYEVAAKDDWTVAHWRETRFKQVYPGLEVTVLMADRTEASGGHKLSTVRGSYTTD